MLCRVVHERECWQFADLGLTTTGAWSLLDGVGCWRCILPAGGENSESQFGGGRNGMVDVSIQACAWRSGVGGREARKMESVGNQGKRWARKIGLSWCIKWRGPPARATASKHFYQTNTTFESAVQRGVSIGNIWLFTNTSRYFFFFHLNEHSNEQTILQIPRSFIWLEDHHSALLTASLFFYLSKRNIFSLRNETNRPTERPDHRLIPSCTLFLL